MVGFYKISFKKKNFHFYFYCCWYCCCSVTQSCPAICDTMDCSMPGCPVFHHLLSLLKFMSTELGMPSNHLVLCYPLLLLPSIFPSNRIFSTELTLCIRWPKYWSFSLSISLSSKYSGLISFRIDWFDLLEVQVSLKSLLQKHSSKHQFFGAHVSLRSSSHIHTWTTGKRIALIIWTFMKNTAIVHSVKWEAHFQVISY